MTSNEAKIVIRGEDKTGAAVQSAKANLRSMSDAASTANKVMGALGLGVSVAGILTMSKSVLDGLDALNDWKDATGASIENLSALEGVARRTGTSMDTVGQAVLKLNQGLKERGPRGATADEIKRTCDPGCITKVVSVMREEGYEIVTKRRLAFNRYGQKRRNGAGAYVLKSCPPGHVQASLFGAS